MTPQATSEGTDPKPLFYEPGASWWWVLAGPARGGVDDSDRNVERRQGRYLVPAIFLVMVSAFVALQVKAARIHVSVELTEDALRQGTETILISRNRQGVSGSRELTRHPGRSWRGGSRRGRSANWSGYRVDGQASVSSSPAVAPRRPGRVVIVTCGRR